VFDESRKMNHMYAISIVSPGGPDVLTLVEMQRPDAGEGQVLIKVYAAGVNRPDVLQRLGGYPPPAGASPVPGLEVAGEVVALGQGTRRYKIGDQVCALVPGGGYAEYCVAAEDNCLPVPQGYSYAEAACLPETYFTVWTNVFQRGALKAGETLLVHGGSSGIGSTAIMLGKAFGAQVVVTAGSDYKCAWCVNLGADVAINYKSSDFVVELEKLAIKPDVILDMVGGDYVARNFKVAAMHARIVQIAFQQGSKIEADFMPIMLKRLTYTGSTLRPRSVAEKAIIARELEEQVWPLLNSDKCRPQVFKSFALGEAGNAHQLMESSAHVGKIVLVW
jgi:NADPH:quinone reductase